MWTYQQSTGRMTDPTGRVLAIGYSGHGAGLNNPAMQDVEGVGPLPQGRYVIGPPLDPPDHLGPIAMPLTPARANRMFGRSAFFIHGDNAAMNHTASDGCIVLARTARLAIHDSADHTLEVIP